MALSLNCSFLHGLKLGIIYFSYISFTLTLTHIFVYKENKIDKHRTNENRIHVTSRFVLVFIDDSIKLTNLTDVLRF